MYHSIIGGGGNISRHFSSERENGIDVDSRLRQYKGYHGQASSKNVRKNPVMLCSDNFLDLDMTSHDTNFPTLLMIVRLPQLDVIF